MEIRRRNIYFQFKILQYRQSRASSPRQGFRSVAIHLTGHSDTLAIVIFLVMQRNDDYSAKLTTSHALM